MHLHGKVTRGVENIDCIREGAGRDAGAVSAPRTARHLETINRDVPRVETDNTTLVTHQACPSKWRGAGARRAKPWLTDLARARRKRADVTVDIDGTSMGVCGVDASQVEEAYVAVGRRDNEGMPIERVELNTKQVSGTIASADLHPHPGEIGPRAEIAGKKHSKRHSHKSCRLCGTST